MSDDDSRHTESSQEEEEEEEEYEGEPPGQPQGRGSTFVNVKGTGPTTVGDSTHYHGNARIVNNFIVKGEEAALKILTWATQGLQLPNSANQQSIAYTNPGSSLNNTLQITQGSEPTVTEPEVTQPGEDRNVTRAESTVVITEQETTYSTKEQTTVNSLEQVNHSEPATTRKTVSSERTESIVVVTEQETTYSTKEESRVNSVEQAQPSVLPEPATSLEGQNIPSEQGFPEVATLPEVSVGKPPVDNRDGSREEASTSEGASGPAAQPENENRDVEVYSAPVAVRDQSGIARPWWERVVPGGDNTRKIVVFNELIDGVLADLVDQLTQTGTRTTDLSDLNCPIKAKITGPVVLRGHFTTRDGVVGDLSTITRSDDVVVTMEGDNLSLGVHLGMDLVEASALYNLNFSRITSEGTLRITCSSFKVALVLTSIANTELRVTHFEIVELGKTNVDTGGPGVLNLIAGPVLTVLVNNFAVIIKKALGKALKRALKRAVQRWNRRQESIQFTSGSEDSDLSD